MSDSACISAATDRPGLELCVLGSGSSGNTSIVRVPGVGALMIDAGLGPRVVAKRMAAFPGDRRVGLADLRAVCLTHLDSDHFNLNWLATLARLELAVYCHASRLDELEERAGRNGLLLDTRAFDAETFEPLPGVSVQPIEFAHDETGSHGFVVESGSCRIGYATDLGHVPEILLERFCDLDILAIESNYDPDLQRNSGRPWFLQKRITGGSGHLSNQQALAAVKSIFDRHDKRRLPRHVVLLHRSRDCNCPDLLRTLFTRDKRIASRLVLAEPYSRTEWLCASTADSGVGRQMTLAF